MLIKHEDLKGNSVEDKVELPHKGVVVDNKDPDKIGRVRVMMEVFEGIPVYDLPWIAQKTGSFLGGSKNSGKLEVPEMFSMIEVTFPTGEYEFGFYDCTWATTETKIDDIFFDWKDYPEVWGFKDSKGNKFKVNKKRGTVQFVHYTGTSFLINTDGSVVCDTLVSFIINTPSFIVNCVTAVVNATLTTLNSLVHITQATTSDATWTSKGDVIGGGISLDGHTHFAPHEAGNTSPPS